MASDERRAQRWESRVKDTGGYGGIQKASGARQAKADKDLLSRREVNPAFVLRS